MVKSTFLSFAKVTRPSTSLSFTLTHSPIFAIPGFPGAQINSSHKAERLHAYASACSRPPLPITSIFIAF